MFKIDYEIEPTIVICLLRLVIRYIIELEQLDKSEFTKSQLKCFEETKKSISIYLLPSLDKILSSFYNDLSNLQNQTSQSIISSLQHLHQYDIYIYFAKTINICLYLFFVINIIFKNMDKLKKVFKKFFLFNYYKNNNRGKSA
jgi:hypothetical protein